MKKPKRRVPLDVKWSKKIEKRLRKLERIVKYLFDENLGRTDKLIGGAK